MKHRIKDSNAPKILTVTFGKSTLNIYKWYKLFMEGLDDVQYVSRPERSSMLTPDENVEAVKKIVMDIRCFWDVTYGSEVCYEKNCYMSFE